MTGNNTCIPANSTSCHPPASGSSAGLAAGVIIFLLLIVIAAGLIVYKYFNRIRDILPLGHRRSQKEKDYTETQVVESHQYTSLSREPSIAQTPIYENLTARAGSTRRSAKDRRSSAEPEEDLYLQCDLPDDAIYSNDPACNLSFLPESHEEDVYIMPDS